MAGRRRCRPAPSRKISDLLSGGRRVVLAAIEANEPVLALKITGAGPARHAVGAGRHGMKAVTIRVNDVEGVGGFVLPGDRVDVVLTRQIEKGTATTEVVLQNTRVLAVDQIADERAVKATVAKSVTLEVGTVAGAEGLACRVGRQSVAAAAQGRRNRRDAARARSRSTDLGTNEPVSNGKVPTTTIVGDRVRTSKQEYTVPVEGRAMGPWPRRNRSRLAR